MTAHTHLRDNDLLNQDQAPDLQLCQRKKDKMFRVRHLIIASFALANMIDGRAYSAETLNIISNKIVKYEISAQALKFHKSGEFSDGTFIFHNGDLLSQTIVETAPFEQFGSTGDKVEIIAQLDFSSIRWEGDSYDYNGYPFLYVTLTFDDEHGQKKIHSFSPTLRIINKATKIGKDQYLVTRSDWTYLTTPFVVSGKVSNLTITIDELIDHSSVSIKGIKLRLTHF